MKNTLIEKVAIQLKAAKTKEEFDSIIKYHFNNCLEQYKKELEKYGVKFDNFVEEDIKDSVDNDSNLEIDINALTKMFIDKPIVKKNKAKNC